MSYRLGIIGIGLLLLLSLGQSYAQSQRQVSIIGHVYDADTHQPLQSVSIQNINQNTGTLTDSAGAYHMKAADYNWITFSYIGYFSDTFQVNALYVRQKKDILLHKNNYSIAPVDIIGHRPNYQRDSVNRRYWFSGALNEEKTNGWGAVEHPISALYDALSGRQKRIWRFQKDYKEHEQQKYISSRIHPWQIEQLFDLKGDSLKAFMLWYKPSYYFVRNTTDYNLLIDIRRAVNRFRIVYRKDSLGQWSDDIPR